jgi:hypothetical protein
MSRFLYFTIPILLIIQLSLLAQFAGGSGTESDPWLIRTPENLDSLRYYLGADNADKYYKQIADIDLGVAPWNVGEGWEPIGRDSTVFQADYNGDGYKISNLTINRPDESYIGLFGSVKDAHLDKISLVNLNIIGGSIPGGLVGVCYNLNGLISNSFTTGTITGGAGLVGIFHNNSSTELRIVNCYSRCTAEIGITVGVSLFSCIKNSYCTGGYGFSNSSVYDFSSMNYWDVETSGCINSYSAEGRTTKEMTQYSENTYVGWDFENTWMKDIYGMNDGYPILQTQLSKSVPAKPEILSTVESNSEIQISWNNPSTQINGELLTDLTAIYITRNNDLIETIVSPVIGAFQNYSDIVTEPGFYIYGIYAENSSGKGVLAEKKLYSGQMFAGGIGTETDPFLISLPEHLNNVRYALKENKVSKYFLQTADIDLNVTPWNENEGWEPIDNFTGIYDGNGFKISNLFIYRPLSNKIGLFSDGGYLKNITLENAIVTGNDYVGSLLGYNSSLDNIISTARVKGVNYIGGLAGYNNSYISNCSFLGIINGNDYIGGISGVCAGEILNSMTNCEINGSDYLGGLVGSMQIINLISTPLFIEQSYSEGTVTGAQNIGGIIGKIGNNVDIFDTYTKMNVSGTYRIAGFTPIADAYPVNIKNCYSVGKVTNTGYSGGFVCEGSSANINYCYWDIETSGLTYSDGGEGRTTAEMINPNFDYTYTGWDFVNTWKQDIDHNDGYPYLAWQYSGIENSDNSIPQNFTLTQNSPNPFNPVTKISYSLPQGFRGDVKLSIYNANGQLVKELVNEKISSGIYSVELNASDLNSGLYIYRLKTASSDIAKKMILLK